MFGMRSKELATLWSAVFLFGAVALCPPAVCSGDQGQAAVRPDEAKSNAGGTRAEKAPAAEEGKQPAADTSNAPGPAAAKPEAADQFALVDPGSGKLLDVKDVDPQKIIKLPPGVIKGRVVEPNGKPHPNTKIALIDSRTGQEVMSTTTNAQGEYVLKDVAEGLYIVHVGNPGIGALVEVTARASAGTLDIMIPKALTIPRIPLPDWAPSWMHAHPLLSSAGVVAGGVGVVGGSTHRYLGRRADRRRSRRRQRISPTVP